MWEFFPFYLPREDLDLSCLSCDIAVETAISTDEVFFMTGKAPTAVYQNIILKGKDLFDLKNLEFNFAFMGNRK